jgi:hypothetical protein
MNRSTSTAERKRSRLSSGAKLIGLGLLIALLVASWQTYRYIVEELRGSRILKLYLTDEERWGPPILKHSLGELYSTSLSELIKDVSPVIQAQFPDGSPEQALVDELAREGFEPEPDRAGGADGKDLQHARSWNLVYWNSAPWSLLSRGAPTCEPHHLLVSWSTDQDGRVRKLTSKLELCYVPWP